jgi:hypothetical protein
MLSPMMRMRAEMIGQPQTMARGPPLFQAWPKVVKHPARIRVEAKSGMGRLTCSNSS